MSPSWLIDDDCYGLLDPATATALDCHGVGAAAFHGPSPRSAHNPPRDVDRFRTRVCDLNKFFVLVPGCGVGFDETETYRRSGGGGIGDNPSARSGVGVEKVVAPDLEMILDELVNPSLKIQLGSPRRNSPSCDVESDIRVHCSLQFGDSVLEGQPGGRSGGALEDFLHQGSEPS